MGREDTFIDHWKYWWSRKKYSVSEFFEDLPRSWRYYAGTRSPPIRYSDLLPRPEIPLSAYAETGQAEWTIPVLKQRSYTGYQKAISSALANTRCADLGINGVLEKLNATLGTSYTLGSKMLRFLGIVQLRSILEPYVTRNEDFGTVYAHLHPYWYLYDVASMKHELRIGEEEDVKMRRKVLIDGRITKREVLPRRVWDLYANRVVPVWVVPVWEPVPVWNSVPACNSVWRREVPSGGATLSAISHAWADRKDRVNVMTPINGYEWPVPMPKDANLDLIRIEMLNHGARYAWLDVLCLRQEGGKNEHLRLEEWKLDVPTIGWVYEMAAKVVCYFNGLGRPLNLPTDYFESDRCWFRRAWTLQEFTRNPIIGGRTGNDVMEREVQKNFNQRLTSLRKIRQDYASINAILLEMQNRVSTKPLDRVAGLVYLLKPDFIPIYEAEQSPADAWEILVDAMDPKNREELLFYYPEPGNGPKRWRPSWQQAMIKNVIRDHSLTWSLPEFSRTGNPDGDWYTGYRIESGDVRGLGEVPKEEKRRGGQLVVKNIAGASHAIRIVADHKCPIPDGSYTLIGPMLTLSHLWVVGRLREDGKFEKLSVFKTLRDGDLYLEEFGVKKNVRTELC